ncbi:hypothetical protein HK100_006070, partial [Physocladia obscura]
MSSSSVLRQSVSDLLDAKIDTRQAKVWNPNSVDSWEPDMRGYHSVEDSDYPLPSDEIEQNRLETQHYILRARFGGYDCAFMEKLINNIANFHLWRDIVYPEAKELVKLDGTKVLDVGCAKGFWLESVRKENPFGEYHGVDIAENLATEVTGYGNIQIRFGNVLETLPYEDNTFDY